MESGPILIQIDWLWLLGIFGTLLGLAYYTGSRFRAIETDITWLKKGLDEIKEDIKDISNNQQISKDNKRLKLIANASPLKLQPEGLRVLEESGMKAYVDTNEGALHEQCGHDCDISAYEIQENVFDLFDNIEFDKTVDKKLKDFAYAEGMSVETIRRIGAIYFRDKCLAKCQLEPADVDKTKPELVIS